MSNRRKIRKAPEPPAAVIVRASDRDDPATFTYFAMRAAEAPVFVAEMNAYPDAPGTMEILDHDALPLVVHSAPWALAGRPPRTVMTVGTSVGDEWETWHAGPIEPEPVPGSAAWHAMHDQVQAARSAAERHTRDTVRRGGRVRHAAPGDQPPAIREMMRRFEDGCLNGTTCPHKRPDRAEVTHQFGCRPDVRLCERCAKDLLPYGPDTCDLCGTEKPPGDCTQVTVPRGHLLLHMSLCDRCYPEGADAPRTTTGVTR